MQMFNVVLTLCCDALLRPRLQCEIRALFSVTGKLLVQAIGKLLS